MVILGIESSCDETSAAVIDGNKKTNKIELLSNVTATSIAMHAKTGGIVPENAAREQVRYIIPVIEEAIKNSGKSIDEIDAISVTYGPGLIGSLLIGVETAKTLSFAWNKPLIPTNHLFGHIYANFIETKLKSKPYVFSNNDFPAVGLIVSGGHTDLILLNSNGSIKWLGGTLDDAAGEAMDKIGRIIGLPYPGGPHIEKRALEGNTARFNFPSPMIHSKNFDFSFSGLKAATMREVIKIGKLDDQTVNDISASVQNAVIDVLVKKTLKAVDKYNAKSILVGGGVSANQALRTRFQSEINDSKLEISFFAPEKWLCTDNGAMIAVAGLFNDRTIEWQDLNANPGLYFD